MCFGPSHQQIHEANAQEQLTQTLQADYAKTFANQQQILGTLNSTLQPIVQAGPSQQGFSAAENAALSTQAIDSNAAGVQQAERAVGAQENSAGGGKSFLPSGVNAQINAGIANAGEANLSNEQLGITQANYAAGHANWQTALAGEQNAANSQNPLGYAGATTNSSSAAFNEANTVQTQTNNMWSSLLGGIVGVATAPFTGGASLLGSAKGQVAGNLSTGGGADVNSPLSDNPLGAMNA